MEFRNGENVNMHSVDRIFTTASEEYFLSNGIQLARSLLQNSNIKLTVYSEDDLSKYNELIDYHSLKYRDEVEIFNKNFRSHYGGYYKFLPYMLKMDLWFFKIAAQRQHVESCPKTFSLFLDSDSVVLNKKFCTVVDAFIQPAASFDVGIFRRSDTYLHPETGFVTLRSSERLIAAYEKMFNDVLDEKFRNLPSWTDSSLLENEILNNRITYLDFCTHYGLNSNNPIYESNLSKSYVHLKGARKGKFSHLKHFFRKYS
jgi:hypothetical protein